MSFYTFSVSCCLKVIDPVGKAFLYALISPTFVFPGELRVEGIPCTMISYAQRYTQVKAAKISVLADDFSPDYA